MRFALAFLLVVAALSPGRPASAQDDEKLAARKLISTGDRQLKKGDSLMKRGAKGDAQDAYLAALKNYNAAFKSFPDPKIYFAIGLAEKRLGRFLESLAHFELLLSEAPEVTEALRGEVERHIRQVKQNLGVVFFRVEPRGATIFVNDEEVGTAPLSRPHYVVPGSHSYRIVADGYLESKGEVNVEAGEAREDQINLVRRPDDKPIPNDDGELKIKKPPPEPAGPSKNPLWVGVGLTGAMVVGATISGLYALNRHGTFEDANATLEQREKAQKRGQQAALATDVLVIGAVAAATYTAYYYVVVYSKADSTQERAAAEPAVSFSPTVAPGFAGAAVLGRF